jgi:hypothetical protein
MDANSDCWRRFRWPPPLHFVSKCMIEILSRFCQKRMLIQNVPRPQGFSPILINIGLKPWGRGTF